MRSAEAIDICGRPDIACAGWARAGNADVLLGRLAEIEILAPFECAERAIGAARTAQRVIGRRRRLAVHVDSRRRRLADAVIARRHLLPGVGALRVEGVAGLDRKEMVGLVVARLRA